MVDYNAKELLEELQGWEGRQVIYSLSLQGSISNRRVDLEDEIRKDFKSALWLLGLSDKGAAKLLWTSARQIRRWMDPGKRGPSAQVMIILKGELEKKLSAEI